MPIYEYKGVHYDIDTADPAIAKKKILDNLPPPKGVTDYAKDFGKSAASLADTGINMATGMLDYGAYNLARAAGRSPEQATQETASPKDYLGRAFGITQDPAYQQELSRQAMNAVGGTIQDYAVKPLSSATGLPEQDVSSMVNSAMLGAGVKAQPYINRAGQKVAQGMYAAEPYVKSAITTPTKGVFYDFPKGVIEGLVNKEYNPATSAMIPLRDTYTPPAAAERFMGQAKTPPYKIGEGPSSGPLPNMPEQSLSQLESQARPTSELVGSRTGQIAQAMSPKTLAGETLVPLRGQGMQAFGERVGRGVRTEPLQAMGEVGLTALTGIPFKTLGQGIGELGARYLGAKTGFMPGFSDKLTQAQGRAGIQGQMPQTPLLTNNPSAPGPVNPSTMYVSPEGVAGSNMNQVSQAGAQQKYAPQPVPQTPAQVAQQAAASKIISPVAPTPQSIPQIAASKIEGAPPVQAAPMQAPQIQNANNIVAQQQAFAKSQLPPARAPIQAPVAQPSNIINSKLTKLDEEMTALRENNMAEGVKPNTPAGDAYSKQMNEMSKQAQALQKELDLAKKAEKAQKKTPGNVSQMIVPDSSGTFNALKLPDNASAMERKIAMAPQASRDIIEQNLRKQLASADTKSKALLEETLKLFDKYRFK